MATKTEIIELMKQQVASFQAQAQEEQVGTVLSVADGTVRMSGLSRAKASEMLEFAGGIYGVALNLEEETVGAVILGDSSSVKQGDTVKTTGRILSVPVSDAVLGRVLNPLGEAIDGKAKIIAKNIFRLKKLLQES